MKKIIAFLVVIVLSFSNIIVFAEEDTMLSSSNTASNYLEYVSQNEKENLGTETVLIKAADFSSFDGTAPKKEGEVLYIPDGSTVRYKFNLKDAGMYNLVLCYAAAEGKGLTIERGIKINGKIPFDSAESISLNRIFKDGEDFKKEGNEYRPKQIEQEVFSERYITGNGIQSNTVFEFKFNAGENEIELVYLSEPMKLKYIKLCRREQAPSYSEYLTANASNSGKASGEIKFQAENSYLKSDMSLFPISDRSSAANEPVSTIYTKLNSIGGENWSSPKQWISWKFTVEEDGWYNLGIRLRQNFSSGTVSNRSLYIDGEMPFAECEELAIKHSREWQMFTPNKNGESYKFYLKSGEHTLTLYNSIGVLSNVINKTNECMTRLSSVYRQIMMITGPNPDTYRDYKIKEILPSAMTAFEDGVVELRDICNEIERLAGKSSTGYASIQKLLIQLESFVKKPSSIPARLDTFRSNISDISSWVLDSVNQPLLIDYFVFEPVNNELPKADCGFFKNLVFGVEKFFQSFVNDYNNISFVDSQKVSDSITLWMGATAATTSGANVIGSGRDQATALKNLTDSYFTPQKKISVNVRLVDMASLLPAVASKMGPDVAIGQDRANPMNYAYRGALLNLSEFRDIKEATAEFFPEALTSFRYGDEIYALPETFAFSLMFYRTDVLSELDIEIPKTWEELYTIIPKLSNKYMTVGLPLLAQDNIELFLALLYQKGGQVYDEGYTKTLLDSEISIDAFNIWTDFYTKYGVDQKVDLLTRFRTGESPIVITQYSFYNQIEATAPELTGKWGVTTVPGFNQDENYVYGTGTGAVIFKNTKNKESAWEFLKWWTSADTQVDFNQELEAILGESARIPTANAKALQRLPWNSKILSVINEQSKYAKGLPEVPGSYLTTRYLSNAARLVINNGVSARDSIMSYSLQINDEMTSMRNEFGLDD